MKLKRKTTLLLLITLITITLSGVNNTVQAPKELTPNGNDPDVYTSASDSDEIGTTYVDVGLFSYDGTPIGLKPTVDVTRDSAVNIITSVSGESSGDGSGGGGVSVSVTVNVDVFDTINIYIPGVDAHVAEVYSANNTVGNAYYYPSINELVNLEEFIEKTYKLTEAYTGFFDLDRKDAFKTDTSQSRALEILGYDFLLQNEEYKWNGLSWSYNPTAAPQIVSKGLAVMDIYKALGCNKYTFTFATKKMDHKIEQSPALQDIPGFIENVDDKIIGIEVATTRTNKELYYDRAERDLRIPQSEMEYEITGEEFIILLKEMMYYYGEPVMSDSEMLQLLQVYGVEVPVYLSQAGQDAFLYLKSRGVLNIDLDYSQALKLEDMLEILMCVKDTDSRTNYKEIQITASVDSPDLYKAGYFERPVYLETEDNSITINQSEVQYSYANAKYYDYYIEYSDQTKFAGVNGGSASYLFVPSEPGNEHSSALEGSRFAGIIKGEDGKNYYHFQIPIMDTSDDYFDKSSSQSGKSNMFQINSKEGSDLPHYMWLEQGGGVYTFASESNGGKVVNLQRRPFNESEFGGSVSTERKEQALAETHVSWLDKLKGILSGNSLVVKADAGWKSQLESRGIKNSLENWTPTAGNTIYAEEIDTVDIKVYNVQNGNITGLPMHSEIIQNIDFSTEADNYWTFTITTRFVKLFYATIERKQTGHLVNAMSSLQGEYLVDYNNLVELGYAPSVSDYSTLVDKDNDAILVLTTSNGEIILNNETKEIVVGDVVYALAPHSNTRLWSQQLTDDGGKLYIDMRAMFGWSSENCALTFTGNGTTGTINAQKLIDVVKDKSVISQLIKMAPAFDQNRYAELTRSINGSEHGYSGQSLLLTRLTTLGNWTFFEGYREDDGSLSTYLFVYYPKKAFESVKLVAPDDSTLFHQVTGHKFESDTWCVRGFEVSMTDGLNSGSPGGLFLDEDAGWVYNLPDKGEFDIKDYLSGNIPLPIYQDYTSDRSAYQVYLVNVNYIPGLEYGTRSYIETDNAKTGVINWDGQTMGSLEYVSSMDIIPAPAGITRLLFGSRKNIAFESTSNVLQTVLTTTSRAQCYYGTMCVEPKVSNGEVTKYVSAIYNSYSGSGNRRMIYTYQASDDFIFYRTAKIWQGGSENNFLYRYTVGDTSLSTSYVVEDKQSALDEEVMAMIDAETIESYNSYDKFSLRWWVYEIDSATSQVLYFTFMIVPLVGILLVTVLVFLAIMCQYKFVKIICAKTVDPIKLLTFGIKDCETFSFQSSWIALFSLYLVFGMILDGNLLRLIIWVMEFYSALVEYIQYL